MGHYSDIRGCVFKEGERKTERKAWLKERGQVKTETER